MFTGIIKDVGTIKNLKSGEDGSTLIVVQSNLVNGAIEGASIAVNGVCLTVVSFDDASFAFQVIPETLNVTNLGSFKVGDKVNLEPSLKLQDGIDGHLVSGHVDCVGGILEVGVVEDGGSRKDEGVRLRIKYPKEIDQFIVYKGSIAVNGVSLTIAKVENACFEIALIEHTLKNSNLGILESGDKVNLEVDMMARYVLKLLGKDGK
ncbi:riboflavin synthase [Candidatus Peregrinibacteria bacterium]|nr:riboflavin synthase [Candidatus Peregrinibacteria bacterium]